MFMGFIIMDKYFIWMIIQELKDKYHIKGTYNSYYREIEYLFSGYVLDPEFQMEANVEAENIKYWDVVYAFGPRNTVMTQMIIFKDKEGYDNYIKDGIVIFEDKQA